MHHTSRSTVEPLAGAWCGGWIVDAELRPPNSTWSEVIPRRWKSTSICWKHGAGSLCQSLGSFPGAAKPARCPSVIADHCLGCHSDQKSTDGKRKRDWTYTQRRFIHKMTESNKVYIVIGRSLLITYHKSTLNVSNARGQ